MLKIVIVCILAGIGAGISTGFAGLSAAVFITPLLTGVLGIPVFDAVGVSLASDVLASAVSSVTYKKYGNINIRDSRVLLFIILAFTVIGTVIGFLVTSSETGNGIMSWWLLLSEFALGLSFIIRAEKNKEMKKNPRFDRFRSILTVFCGIYIGALCGFQGAGGGLMMLFTLTVVMGYAFKTGVGTSVFMMTFTALIGAVSHFVINGLPDLKILLITIASTFVSAQAASLIANKVSNKILKRITGAILILTALVILYLSPPKDIPFIQQFLNRS